MKCHQRKNIIVAKSKPIIDKIDKVLAKHYGFTEEGLDFIVSVNYSPHKSPIKKVYKQKQI